jgi:hypothetical protein
MKKIWCILIVISLFIGCKKQNTEKEQDDALFYNANILPSGIIWGQNASDTQNVIKIRLVPNSNIEPCIYLYNGKLYCFDDGVSFHQNQNNTYTILPNSLLYLGGDGYWRLKIDKKYIKNLPSKDSWWNEKWPKYSSYKNKELVIVMGDEIAEPVFDYYYDGSSKLELFNTLNDLFNYVENNSTVDWDPNFAEYENIVSSKYLTENVRGKTIKYAPANLLANRLTGEHTERGGFSWLPITVPWVEGEEGPGIGAFIEVKFDYKWDRLAILNGYVDPHKMKLFKENNRVKTMTVIDVDNKTQFDVDFEDYVYYKSIIFSKPTKHIKLIIKDVYKGTKYDDTCISAIRTFDFTGYDDKYVDNSILLNTLLEKIEKSIEVK